MKQFANYFDYAAATPMLPEAKKAMEPYLSNQFYNPSALYLKARQNRIVLEEARAAVAKELGAKPLEIIFTAGGTEANNMAIQGVLRTYPQAKVLVSAVEHESILAPAELFNYQLLSVDKKGVIQIEALKKAITNEVVLISVMHTNNEVGAIQPISEISQIVRAVNKERRQKGTKLPLYLHSDACQAVNYLDIQVSRLGVDLLTINAGKIYGPKQCGALYMKRSVKMQPLILGGGQEKGWRSGTQNLANIVGFAKALQIIRQDYRQEAKRLQQMRDKFMADVQKHIPSTVINGPVGHDRLANNISLALKGVDNERLVMMLDEAGFAVATGSACKAASDELSHVLKAMKQPKEIVQGTIRITLGRYNTAASLQALADTIVKIASRLS